MNSIGSRLLDQWIAFYMLKNDETTKPEFDKNPIAKMQALTSGLPRE